MQDEKMIDAVEGGFADEIPPFLRKPEKGTAQAGQFWLSCINAKLRKLEALGLRPHDPAGEQGRHGVFGGR